ncbi:MAG: peptidoglycan DL-endopeptidase CwlO [Frankiaceae bacterium]|jgi:cell wall-associated NlpC family hydrolase|nr:peptidoglycan DL-endopeptidase CwlO [Frankiaceae bacterium]
MTGRRGVSFLLAAVITVAGAVLPATTASASPGLDAAKRKAAALRKAVDALELQAAQAVEDYNAANDDLARAVSARLGAQAAVDDAARAADAGSDTRNLRIRALYMSGGAMTLYASVMDSADLHDAFGRIANVNSVLRRDGVAVAAADRSLHVAETAAATLKAVALRQTRLERRVADAAQRVQRALGTQQALLAEAGADVLRIAEADRIAAEAAAQRAFEARLASARSAAGFTGPGLAALRGDATSPPTAVAARAIEAARTQLGKPYQWGAVGPESFDCSGLTGWAYRQAGLDLPRTSRQQWFAGSHPDLGALLPGDLLFWGTNPANPGSIHHVALYLGNGLMIAAPHTGANVRVQPVYLNDFFGVTRPTEPGSGGPPSKLSP